MSKSIKKLKRRVSWLYILLPMFICVFCALAEGPEWWTDRDVLTSDAPNDYAPVNMGQLKWIATNAYDECIAQGMLQNTQHDSLYAVLESWFGEDSSCNDNAVNVGQIKNLASLFYAWMNDAGYNPQLTISTGGNDFAVANIGQVKNVFNFVPVGGVSVDTDYDQDGLIDAWEMQIVNADPNDLINSVEDVRPQDDFDGDGVSNGDEANFGTNPLSDVQTPPVVGFTALSTIINEPELATSITVAVSPAPSADVIFTVSVGGGTAVIGKDYSFTTANIVLTAASPEAVIQLAVLKDEVREPTETVKLLISDLNNEAVVGIREHYVQITDDAIDSDSDDLPDWWETKYWGSLGQDASGDPDGDTWDNLKEYRLGSDPTMGWIEDTSNILNLTVITPLDE